MTVSLDRQHALLIEDLQRDFLAGGSLAVPGGDEVIPVLNRYIRLARNMGMPIFASRDWHPKDHCSFKSHGGAWPDHCVAGTPGAEFASDLKLPRDAVIVSKATRSDAEAYSSFDGTDLALQLRNLGIKRLLVGGLATDYCVLYTVCGALAAGFGVLLLTDAIRAVNVKPEDGECAELKMRQAGAIPIRLEDCS
jgi:nicotinamidase/pyrazinamidase